MVSHSYEHIYENCTGHVDSAMSDISCFILGRGSSYKVEPLGKDPLRLDLSKGLTSLGCFAPLCLIMHTEFTLPLHL